MTSGVKSLFMFTGLLNSLFLKTLAQILLVWLFFFIDVDIQESFLRYVDCENLLSSHSFKGIFWQI